MDFDDRRPKPRRRFDLLRIGGDEQRDADTGLIQLRHHRCQQIVLPDGVEAALGREFPAPLGNETGRMWTRFDGDGHQFRCRRHFEIERLDDLGLQTGNVVVADVAAILAQMRGDAVGPGFDGNLGGANRIGMRPPRALRTVAT